MLGEASSPRKSAARLARVAVLVAGTGLWLLLPSVTSAQATSPVTMSDDVFDQMEVHVVAGSSVVWTNGPANVDTHTVTADDGSFDSGDVPPGNQFRMEFDTPGSYPYFCTYHGGPGGVGMAGVIVVE